mgnify:CR=1 FL=1|tara:strand:+ start:71 stop:337 length:267 start_codon:yes stop_codon:yes gene_type:complete
MAHIFIYDKEGDILANPNNPRGYYICKIGYFDIRQKIDWPNKKKTGKAEIFIYHGKHKLEGPFKSKDAAKIRAEEMMSEGVKYNKFGK